jgi:hypothetical protein
MPFVFLLALGAALAIGVGYVRQEWGKSDKPLDRHLPEVFEDAILFASSHERDASKLTQFAESLAGDYPIASLALRARAANLPTATAGLDLNPFHAAKNLAKDVVKAATVMTAVVPGVAFPTLLAAQVASHPVGKVLGKAPVIRDVKHEAEKISKSPPFRFAQSTFVTLHPAIFGAMLVASSGKDTLDGKPLNKVLNDVRLKGGGWLKDEGALAANVPVIGQVLGPALTAAGALALGEPIPDAMIDIAASTVPGGPIAQTAVKSGATFAVDLSEGQKLDKATYGAAKAAAEGAAQAAGLPPGLAGNAMDLGLAVAQGKNLQKAGFHLAAGLIKSEGGSLAEKALGAINQSGMGDLVANAKKQLQRELPAGAADIAQNVAKAVAKHPALARFSAVKLARQLHAPEPVTRAVLAATHDAGKGSPVVDPDELEELVGPLPAAPVQIDAAHAALALKAAKGSVSAVKQLAFQKMQSPADVKGSIEASERAVNQAAWAAHYLSQAPDPGY